MEEQQWEQRNKNKQTHVVKEGEIIQHSFTAMTSTVDITTSVDVASVCVCLYNYVLSDGAAA